MTEKTVDHEALTAEVERLRRHSETLLEEKRAERKAKDDALAKLSTVEAERDKLAGDLKAIRLDGPVERLIEQTATDPVIFRALFDRAGYRFELGDDERPRIVDSEGEPLAATGPDGKAQPVAFEPAALACFLLPPSLPAAEWSDDQRRFASVLAGSKATGSGATAHMGSASTVKQPEASQAPPQRFGLK
ncbi:hypothetical protein [Luteimonas qiangzhengi]|uniref:hypothetical protein n=1 Tax=Luteimonas sp. MJ146 TaxID=3129240 RepID=UPI0031BAB64B